MPRGYISLPISPFTDPAKANGRYCSTCDSRFPSRELLEDHPCPALTHICSCGTEFPLYSDVDAHSKTHQPGHGVVDHKAVRRRRFDREQEAKDRSTPDQGPSAGLGFHTRPTPASSLEVVSKYQVPVQPPPPNSVNISKLLRGAAAPTVDLWTIYQPLVLVKTKMFKSGTYTCGKCSLSFPSKSHLFLHHNTHAKYKVFGCLGCGILLSSRKYLPRYHYCTSPSGSLEPGVITTRPLTLKPSMTLMPSNKGKELHLIRPKMLRLNTFSQPHSNLSKTPMQAAFAMNAFSCGVCRVVFESVKLLQRHKCNEAGRIVLNKPLPRPQSSMPWKSMVTPLKSPYPLPQAARNHHVVNSYQNKAVVLSNGTGGQPVTEQIDLDSDDDCYIIESSTIKPNNILSSSTLSVLKR